MQTLIHLSFLTSVFKECALRDALIWQRNRFTYQTLQEKLRQQLDQIEELHIQSGAVVGIQGAEGSDFSPNSIALFLALIEKGCILVPYSSSSTSDRERKDSIAQIEYLFQFDRDDVMTFRKTGLAAKHELYSIIRERQSPGLVLFSSGTSGAPKAAVHDFAALLEKFMVRRKALITLNFLLFDHWGGLNTMLHSLSNGSTIVAIENRAPNEVCALIENTKAELLPATPTFLNLLLLSETYKKFDLNSLKVISYGAEPMPEGTLTRLKTAFPNITLQQTYGLIEVGVLRSKSKDDGSLWVKLGGEGYEMRVIDGILQIKTKSTILGYLNAVAPITSDGWFITGDAVEQDGEYLKILGRKSELINIGGEKVFPIEVEGIIQGMDNISDVTVYAEKNPIMGNILCAKVHLIKEEDPKELAIRLKNYCLERLDRFKVPVKVKVVSQSLYGDRFKKLRADI